MDTWMKKQQAIDAEAQLRELIVNTRGFSAYQDLLKIRRDTLRERKEAQRQADIEKQEMQEMIAIVFISVLLVILLITAILVYFELLDLRELFG